jgi:hypothetical protein
LCVRGIKAAAFYLRQLVATGVRGADLSVLERWRLFVYESRFFHVRHSLRRTFEADLT